jgi:hypothetical protein
LAAHIAMRRQEEDSDDELTLRGVIQTVPHSPIKSSGMEAEQYLNEPLLKKGDSLRALLA